MMLSKLKKQINSFIRTQKARHSNLPNTDYAIEYSFTINGIKYYRFLDIMNLPVDRAMAVIPYYEEMRMRTTREFLLQHTEEVSKILTNRSTIDLNRLGLLNQQLKERLNFIVEPNTILKIASVLYFDASENIYDYDPLYGDKKIEQWKKHKGDSFFFMQPISSLMNVSNKSQEDLTSYLNLLKIVTQNHLENLLSTLSKEELQSERIKNLLKQTEILLN